MIDFIIQIVQIILAVLLVVVILIQHKGAGLGAGFGGGSSPIVQTKRGVDLFLHKLTIGLSIAFFLLAFITIFI
jgi:preprotein translocase subunit SecG